jgi:hypothetical protein
VVQPLDGAADLQHPGGSAASNLFLAVYEHGLARVRSGEDVLVNGEWESLRPEQVVRRAVLAVVDQSTEHHRFLRAVVLLSSSHNEIHRRGSHYVRDLRSRFVARVASVTVGRARESRASAAFDTAFATAVFRTAYGEDFLPSRDWRQQLVATQQEFLLTVPSTIGRGEAAPGPAAAAPRT